MPLVQVIFALNNDYAQEQLIPGARLRENRPDPKNERVSKLTVES
jgi:hypothetical protein